MLMPPYSAPTQIEIDSQASEQIVQNGEKLCVTGP